MSHSPTSSPAPIPELLTHLKADTFLTPPTHTHKDLFIARAPGRLDIMGGIADYTGSLVCELPLQHAAAVAIQRRDDHRLVIKTYNKVGGNGGGVETASNKIELEIDDFYGTASLLPTQTLQKLFTGPNHWAAYFAGAFPILTKHKNLTRRSTGANIACYSTVPIAAGLASSAAITCATLSAITAAYHPILDPLEIAVLAQKVEQQIAAHPCGIMDQVTAILGKKDQLLLLKCQPHDVQGYLPIPQNIMFAGIVSGIKHSVTNAPYLRSRLSASIAHEIIARMCADLGVKKDPTAGYLANISPATYQKFLRPILPEEITGRAFLDTYGPISDRSTPIDPAATYFPRAAAEHHILENHRVKIFVETLQKLTTTKDPAQHQQLATQAGALMLESHRSYSTNAHLGSKETDLLVDLLTQHGPQQGIYGAKITGAGEGGTVAVMSQSNNAAHDALAQTCADYEKRTGIKPEIVTGSSPGSADTGSFKIPLAEL